MFLLPNFILLQFHGWLQDSGEHKLCCLTNLNLYHIQDGFTVILVERGEGLETKAIKTSYVIDFQALVTFCSCFCSRLPLGQLLSRLTM